MCSGRISSYATPLGLITTWRRRRRQAADVAPGERHQAVRDQIEIRLADLLFEFVEHGGQAFTFALRTSLRMAIRSFITPDSEPLEPGRAEGVVQLSVQRVQLARTRPRWRRSGRKPSA